jgi:hypothetical protein
MIPEVVMAANSSTVTPFPNPSIPYHGNDFSMKLYEEWDDKTIYTITGPVTDDVQHNIIISVDRDVQVSTLRDYADWNVASLLGELRACRLLKQDQVRLSNGLPAYRAIFSWWPSDEQHIYLEQIYLLAGTTGYKVTATFTKRTRKTLGTAVERIMFSFTPGAEGEKRR